MRPTVLIVDDHSDFRASARALLELEGFEVVGDVDDGETALATVERLRPDVVLLDVQLPGLDGFGVADELASMEAAPRVVLISSRRRSAYEVRLPGAPVAGFLGKHEREVLGLVAEGLSNDAVGKRLFISERTGEAHVKQIFPKLRIDQESDTNRRVLAVLAFLRSPGGAGES